MLLKSNYRTKNGSQTERSQLKNAGTGTHISILYVIYVATTCNNLTVAQI